MRMGTDRHLTDTAKFLCSAAAWSLGLFAVLRANWFASGVLLPLTRAQGIAATGLLGSPSMPVEVTLACSGADAMALCVGTMLAYPVHWRRRLTGAAGGISLILALNTVRIGTLGHAAASPLWFNALHVYIWPAALMVAIAAYVFAWMQFANGGPGVTRLAPPHASQRFVLLTLLFLFVFAAASPMYLESGSVLAAAAFIARTAAAILSAAGISSHAAANVLWTPRGGFLVTQECVVTPLVPLYLAAVCAYSSTWRWTAAGALAAVPLFVALGIARLLVVVVPGAVGSPLFFVHAFYQLLLAAIVVVAAAWWRHGGRSAIPHASAGLIAGVLFVYLLGPVYTEAIAIKGAAPLDDPQGAIAFLPAFQVALYLALWVAASTAVGWKRFAAGFAVLCVTQAAGLFVLHALATYSGITAHVRDIRGWAIAAPVLIFAAVITNVHPRR